MYQQPVQVQSQSHRPHNSTKTQSNTSASTSVAKLSS